MRAGKLRHRVDIERQVQSQPDADRGGRSTQWVPWLAAEPAELVPLSGREYIAADAKQSSVVARCTVRARTGYEATLRLRHEGVLYGVVAVLPDPTFRRHVSLMLEAGPSDGR